MQAVLIQRLQTRVQLGRAIVQSRSAVRQGGHVGAELIHTSGVGGQAGIELVVAVQLGLKHLETLESLRLGLFGGGHPLGQTVQHFGVGLHRQVGHLGIQGLELLVRSLQQQLEDLQRTGVQGLAVFAQGAQTAGHLTNAVIQSGSALGQLPTAVQQLAHRNRQLIHIAVGGVRQAQVNVLQKAAPFAAGRGNGQGQGEVLHIGGDLNGLGQLAVLVFHVQPFLQAGQGYAHHQQPVAVVDDRAVGHFHVGEFAAVQKGGGQNGKLGLLPVGGGIGETDGHAAALSGHVGGGDFLAVHQIGDLQRQGQLLVAVALIVHVLAVSVPGEAFAVPFKGGAALHHGQVLQAGRVGQLIQLVRVFQPVADDDAPGLTLRVGENVHGFVLGGSFGHRRDGGAKQQRQRKNQRGNALPIAFHGEDLLLSFSLSCPAWSCRRPYPAASAARAGTKARSPR